MTVLLIKYSRICFFLNFRGLILIHKIKYIGLIYKCVDVSFEAPDKEEISYMNLYFV